MRASCSVLPSPSAVGVWRRTTGQRTVSCRSVQQDKPPVPVNSFPVERSINGALVVDDQEAASSSTQASGPTWMASARSSLSSILKGPVGEKLDSLWTSSEPHVIAASGQLIYGVWYILGHLVLSGEGSSDPLGFAFMRELIATSFLLFIARKLEGQQRIENREDLYWVMVVGLFAFGNIGGFLLALSMLPEFTVSCSQPGVPVVCLIISVLLGKDRFNAKSVTGVGLSALGAILVTTASSAGADVGLGDSSNFTVGLLCLAVSVLSYACMYIYLPKLSDKYPPLTTTAWYYTVCSIFTFMVVMQRLDFSVPSLMDQASMVTNPITFLVLLYASLFATVFTYGSVSYASQKLSPSQLSLYNTLQPFCVALISVAFMGKQLTQQEMLGCFSIIVGLFTCQSAKRGDGETSDQSMFGPVFLGSPWSRGLRYRARKLVNDSYGEASIELEEKDYQSQDEMAKDLLMGLQRLDTTLLPWLVTLTGIKPDSSSSSTQFLASVRRLGFRMGMFGWSFGPGRKTMRSRRRVVGKPSQGSKVQTQEVDRY